MRQRLNLARMLLLVLMAVFNGCGRDSDSGGASNTAPASDSAAPVANAGTSPAIGTCKLAYSGPILVNHDGQVIEKLRIVSSMGAAIDVKAFKNVVIRNVRIEHRGGPGISIGANSDSILVENVSIENIGAPATGANATDKAVNISCYGAARATVRRARLTRGSSGIYLSKCADSVLSFIEGHDFRGPFPRGQLVQWDKSDRGTLEDFSVVNSRSSWPEDNVNVFKSAGAQIRRGLIDGNNSPSGVGVIFDGNTGSGVVEDVDAVRMGNGCFSNFDGADGNVFRRTRCRDNVCGNQGRGTPSSNALMFAGRPGKSQIRLESSTYFAACNPNNIVWPVESFAVAQVTKADFTPRAPITLKFCWE